MILQKGCMNMCISFKAEKWRGKMDEDGDNLGGWWVGDGGGKIF